ncbi:MAG: aminoacyl-tRNA hydrolase [Verrucomicrobia bacterium]|nr:aminoacyl-tRNA hydrolase [Verrucomicrobiota bacterium]MBT7066610.1 aminoacyl-tRNA hydrolase [Verrucomicrobiota bacterium]MBT7699764.1 aminoacyl-tRNA hydrolase [Verrucomicrobiota bacterium]
MNVIVGLGNPGKRYERTPHNVGFATMDVLAERVGCRLRRSLRYRARSGKTILTGHPVLLVKPETFMNNSGIAVSAALRYFKARRDQLVLVLDDADLPVGRVRIRAKGGSGGHRGLASVIEHVGGDDFARVRIGVGRRHQEETLVSHVLRTYGTGEWQAIEKVVMCAADAVTRIVESGTEAAMNAFNGQTILEG